MTNSSVTSSSDQALVVIPARLASTRLPNKILADIQGIPMIVRVWQQAMKASIGPVIVACCGSEIRKAIEAVGGVAIETDPDLASGTDRVMAALKIYDPKGNYKYVVNLQGDLPTMNPDDIRLALKPLADDQVDIASLCCEIKNSQDITNPNAVKVATGFWQKNDGVETARAIYFSRQAIPANATTYYHHIGIYAYKRSSLDAYVQLPVSYLEKTEKLEQLRALENGMRIDMVLVQSTPMSVDTAEDLAEVRSQLG